MNRPDVLLVSENSLKEYFYLDESIQGEFLTPAVVYVQDQIVESLLGTSLFKKLLELIQGETINDEENWCYKELLDGYLFNLIAYSVLAEIQVPLTFQTRNKGNVRSSDEHVAPSAMEETKYTTDFYTQRANYYRSRIYNYLKCNCDCFPELKDCPLYGELKPKTCDPVSSGLNLKINRKWRTKL